EVAHPQTSVPALRGWLSSAFAALLAGSRERLGAGRFHRGIVVLGRLCHCNHLDTGLSWYLLLLLAKGFVAVDVSGQKRCFLLTVDLLFGVLAYQHSARVLGRTVLVRQPDSVLVDRGLDDLAVPIHAMDLAHSVGRIQQRIVLGALDAAQVKDRTGVLILDFPYRVVLLHHAKRGGLQVGGHGIEGRCPLQAHVVHVVVEIVIEKLTDERLFLIALWLWRLPGIRQYCRQLIAKQGATTDHARLAVGRDANDRRRLHAHIDGKSQREKRQQRHRPGQHHRPVSVGAQGTIVFVILRVVQFLSTLCRFGAGILLEIEHRCLPVVCKSELVASPARSALTSNGGRWLSN